MNDIRDRLDFSEERTIEDINYCIKMISSNKLYEANFDIDLGENEGQN